MNRASVGLVVGVLIAAGGCGSTKSCKQGTLLVTVTFDGTTSTADDVEVNVTIAGGSPKQTMLAHKSGMTDGSIEIDFPGGYPAGEHVDVTVIAQKAGATLGMATATVQALAAGCRALALTVSAADGGAGGNGAAGHTGSGGTAAGGFGGTARGGAGGSGGGAAGTGGTSTGGAGAGSTGTGGQAGTGGGGITAGSSGASGLGGGAGTAGGAGGNAGSGGADPCAGVTCNTPSPATCTSPSTRRTFALPGACNGGTCSYAQTDTLCPSGTPFCVNGACICSPDGPKDCSDPTHARVCTGGVLVPMACNGSTPACSAGSCTSTIAAAGAIACGAGLVCGGGMRCCYNSSVDGGLAGTCAAACMSRVIVDCDGPSDCPGQICWFTGDVGGEGTGCSATSPCGPGGQCSSYALCDPDSPNCSTGACTGSSVVGATPYYYCR